MCFLSTNIPYMLLFQHIINLKIIINEMFYILYFTLSLKSGVFLHVGYNSRKTSHILRAWYLHVVSSSRMRQRSKVNS